MILTNLSLFTYGMPVVRRAITFLMRNTAGAVVTALCPGRAHTLVVRTRPAAGAP
jgi:hypothetical protein